jgi:hypothetical protein
MHNHTEKTCKHELRVCAECGDVYCLKCNKEWYKEKKSFDWGVYPYIVNSEEPTAISTYGTFTNDDSVKLTQTAHLHTS